MKKTICTCDRCGNSIDDVIYTLTCYAEDVTPGPFGGISAAVAAQNTEQNLRRMASVEKHLCGNCKDALTDGLFIA